MQNFEGVRLFTVAETRTPSAASFTSSDQLLSQSAGFGSYSGIYMPGVRPSQDQRGSPPPMYTEK
jgi:hypothetical protein